MTNTSSNSSGALSSLEQRLGYRFRSPGLLRQAVTHRSLDRGTGSSDNERLEFLGDAVLGHIVAAHLYRALSGAREAELTLKRATLVRRETLAAIARQIDLGRHLRLGPGERNNGVVDNDSVLSDALEAVVGAVYLDGGLAAAQALVNQVMGERFIALDLIETKDPKTLLQELMQGQSMPLPDYQVVATEGALHQQVFHVRCTLQMLDRSSEGSGNSRREAEKAAARILLSELG